MKKFLVRSSAAAFAALVLALSGCGGGGGDTVVPPPDGGGVTPPPPTVSVAQALTTAGAQAANDTSVNSTASFAVLQQNGVPAFTITSPAKVNFAVFSDGKPVSSVTLGSVSFAIAKLVPGTNGDPDKWVSYVYRTESTASGANKTGPGGVPALASAKQATTDPKQSDAALAAAQLVYNPDGYYTYTFRTDLKDPAWTGTAGTTAYSTNGVAFEPGRTHRVAIQLSYRNAAGELIRVNPYYDFTIDASGKSVPVTDAQTRKMVDIGTCNTCHDKLALHGGGRVDTQYCVMCHNPGTVDANSGLNLNMATMVHKIHSGRALHQKGEDYVIWGNASSKHDYSEVAYPQPTRNCVSCHDGSNAKTPQGDNWKSKPTKEACLTCHQTGTTSGFYAMHVTTLKLGASADAIPNSTCNSCHSASSPLSAEKVHWMQELHNAANYEVKLQSVSLKKAATATATGLMTVKYSVVNPKTGAAYNLREGCSGAATTDQAGTAIVGCNTNYRWDVTGGAPQDKFGTFTLYLATETLAGVTLDDNTTNTTYAAYRGVADASNNYTADLTIPAGAKGNARVMIIGSVAERRLDPLTRNPIGASPPTANSDLAYVPVKNAIRDVNVATGGASARRAIVSNDGCNSCHGILGLPMGPQAVAFHKGVRNNGEGCAICHNGNQNSSYTFMSDGSVGPVAGDGQLTAGNTSAFLHESWQAKRFVHGIHYGAMRNYPFTHGNNVPGTYNKDGTSAVAGGASMAAAAINFTAEVAYPGALKNCSNCHVNDSWKEDKSVLGTVVFRPTGKTNMLDWMVLSPKAATCTTCHDAKAVQTHVTTIGGGAFGNFTQNDLLYGGKVFEACEGCHAPGSALGVDKVHAFK